MAGVSTERVRTTYTDLLSWPEDGRRYELYDGEVCVVPAPFPRHQMATTELLRKLTDYSDATGGIALVSPIDIVFADDTVLQPDIVVFTAARKHFVAPDRAICVPPDVAVEVISPGTAANDRGRKLEIFERFGVPEYWILDPYDERLEIRTLRDGRYEPPATVGRGETVASRILPGFSCPLGALFRW
jgi:Uma2 family endonuclease